MKAFLAGILETTRQEVGRMRNLEKGTHSPHRDFPVRGFHEAIAGKGYTSIMAEIKFASPSAGRIRTPEDPVPLAECLETSGAAALSVVTARRGFQGNPFSLNTVSRAVSIPVLCKDFILEEVQVDEACSRGADAVLLIARILAPGRLSSLLTCCRTMGLDALVEVGNRAELDRALSAEARIVGINNRDLDSFEVDLDRFGTLASWVPEGVALVSESGVKNAEDIQRLREQGADAVLVGTALMTSSDPGDTARKLVRAGRKEKRPIPCS